MQTLNGFTIDLFARCVRAVASHSTPVKKSNEAQSRDKLSIFSLLVVVSGSVVVECDAMMLAACLNYPILMFLSLCRDLSRSHPALSSLGLTLRCAERRVSHRELPFQTFAHIQPIVAASSPPAAHPAGRARAHRRSEAAIDSIRHTHGKLFSAIRSQS